VRERTRGSKPRRRAVKKDMRSRANTLQTTTAFRPLAVSTHTARTFHPLSSTDLDWTANVSSHNRGVAQSHYICRSQNIFSRIYSSEQGPQQKGGRTFPDCINKYIWITKQQNYSTIYLNDKIKKQDLYLNLSDKKKLLLMFLVEMNSGNKEKIQNCIVHCIYEK